MSQITDHELLYQPEPPNPVTDPFVDPEWNDVTPIGHGREIGATAPATGFDGGVDPTNRSADEVGGTEASAVLGPETNEPFTSMKSEAVEEHEQQLVATIAELWSVSRTTTSTIA